MLRGEDLNVFSNEAFRQDPYPFFRQGLRDKPIVRNSETLTKPYSVFRHADVFQVFKDWETFSSEDPNVAETGDMALGRAIENFIAMDPPRHTRLRRLAQRGFLPATLKSFAPRAEELSKQRMDYLLEAGEIDIVDDYAAQITVGMISAILGLPVTDWELIRRWTTEIAENVLAPNFVTEFEQDRVDLTVRVTNEMADYFEDYIAERKKDPKENDLVSLMITTEMDGDRFTDREIENTAMLLLLAGNDTTTNLIANFITNMAKFPDQAQLVRDDLSLVPQAIEETLRFSPSLLCMERFVAKPIMMHGIELVPGDVVIPWMAAANRDPDVFDRPDEFDVTRKPNRHIAFAAGVHMCLGSPLARMEGAIAAKELISRAGQIELIGPPELNANSLINGPAHQKAIIQSA